MGGGPARGSNGAADDGQVVDGKGVAENVADGAFRELSFAQVRDSIELLVTTFK